MKTDYVRFWGGVLNFFNGSISIDKYVMIFYWANLPICLVGNGGGCLRSHGTNPSVLSRTMWP